jgi:hypothetical protein
LKKRRHEAAIKPYQTNPEKKPPPLREPEGNFMLHEFYHHLVETKGLELPERVEEKQANGYASEFVKKV